MVLAQIPVNFSSAPFASPIPRYKNLFHPRHQPYLTHISDKMGFTDFVSETGLHG
jgi:hypothetical protein